MTNKINNHLAMVFPGQGSQSVGMLSDISLQFKEVQETFTEASETLGYDLWNSLPKLVLLQKELDKTVHTQPALLAGRLMLFGVFYKQEILLCRRCWRVIV